MSFEKCHKCTKDRHVGCHSTCKHYKEDRMKLDKEAEQKRIDRLVRDIVNGYNPAKRKGIQNSKLRGGKEK